MLTVEQIMSRPVVTVSMDATLGQVRELFERERFHHVIVVDQGKAVGVISDRDLLKRISPFVGNKFNERRQDENTLSLKAHQVMTRHPMSVAPDDAVQTAVDLILKHRFRSLPVLDTRGRPVGIISWKDVLRWGSSAGVWQGPDEQEPNLFNMPDDDSHDDDVPKAA